MVKEKLAAMLIPFVFNVSYQPDYNPTESCLSKIKNHYKGQKLKAVVNEEKLNWEGLIKESVNEL